MVLVIIIAVIALTLVVVNNRKFKEIEKSIEKNEIEVEILKIETQKISVRSSMLDKQYKAAKLKLDYLDKLSSK